MSSVADADARRRRVAELRLECERLRDENDLFEIQLARIAPPGTEQAPEEDAEDAGAKQSKGSKKSKAKTDAPVVRDRLTDAERLDAVTAESELLERVQREAEAANERGLMDLRAACDEVDACLAETRTRALLQERAPMILSGVLVQPNLIARQTLELIDHVEAGREIL